MVRCGASLAWPVVQQDLAHTRIRLNRVIRDIPNQHIIGGNQNVNLRQDIQRRLQ